MSSARRPKKRMALQREDEFAEQQSPAVNLFWSDYTLSAWFQSMMERLGDSLDLAEGKLAAFLIDQLSDGSTESDIESASLQIAGIMWKIFYYVRSLALLHTAIMCSICAWRGGVLVDLTQFDVSAAYGGCVVFAAGCVILLLTMCVRECLHETAMDELKAEHQKRMDELKLERDAHRNLAVTMQENYNSLLFGTEDASRTHDQLKMLIRDRERTIRMLQHSNEGIDHQNAALKFQLKNKDKAIACNANIIKAQNEKLATLTELRKADAEHEEYMQQVSERHLDTVWLYARRCNDAWQLTGELVDRLRQADSTLWRKSQNMCMKTRDLDRAQERNAEAEKKIVELKAALEKQNREAHDLTDAQSSTPHQNNEISTLRDQLKQMSESLEVRSAALRAIEQGLEASIEEKFESVENLQELYGKVPNEKQWLDGCQVASLWDCLVSAAKENIAIKDDIKKRDEKITLLDEEIGQLQGSINVANLRNSGHDEQLAGRNKELEALRRENTMLNNQLAVRQTDYLNLRDAYYTTKKALEQRDAELRAIQANINQRNSYDLYYSYELSVEQRATKEANEKLAASEARLSELEDSSSKAISAAQQNLAQQEEKLNSTRHTLVSAEQNVKDRDAQLAKATAEQEALSDNMEKLKTDIADLEADLQQANKRIAAREAINSNAARAMSAANRRNNETLVLLTARTNELTRLQGLEKAHAEDVAELQRRLTSKQDTVRELENEVEDLEEELKEEQGFVEVRVDKGVRLENEAEAFGEITVEEAEDYQNVEEDDFPEAHNGMSGDAQ